MLRHLFMFIAIVFVTQGVWAKELKVICYNIYNGCAKKAELATWLKGQDADVVAFQELCGFSDASLLALGKQYGHAYTEMGKIGGYPVGITSKTPITVVKRQSAGLHHGMIHVKIEGVDMLVTHFSPFDRHYRMREAKFILNYIKEAKLTNYLLMGDLNANSPLDATWLSTKTKLLTSMRAYDKKHNNSPRRENLAQGDFDYTVISELLAADLTDAVARYVPEAERKTYPSLVWLKEGQSRAEYQHLQEQRIDYIFASMSLRKYLTGAFIDNADDSPTAYISDHLPVGITFTLPPKGAK